MKLKSSRLLFQGANQGRTGYIRMHTSDWILCSYEKNEVDLSAVTLNKLLNIALRGKRQETQQKGWLTSIHQQDRKEVMYLLYKATPDSVNCWEVAAGQASKDWPMVTSLIILNTYNVHALDFQYWETSF